MGKSSQEITVYATIKCMEDKKRVKGDVAVIKSRIKRHAIRLQCDSHVRA